MSIYKYIIYSLNRFKRAFDTTKDQPKAIISLCSAITDHLESKAPYNTVMHRRRITQVCHCKFQISLMRMSQQSY